MNTVEIYREPAALDGVPVFELNRNFRVKTSYAVTAKLEKLPKLIYLPGGRCVQTDSFVDLDEAEKILRGILRRHFARFGYSNNKLLFGAAAQEMPMFLNDNDCATADEVFAIAKFFFEGKFVAGKSYSFCYPHIFEKNSKYPASLCGLMMRLADKNGGILNAADAKDYLQKTMLTFSSLNQLLQINESDTFFLYDAESYLLGKTIGITAQWCRRLHDKLDKLFRTANVAYVVPRDIKSSWLDTLPPLPHSLPWTPLLLQDILNKYPEIGFKSISSKRLKKSCQRLAAAFVPMNSPLTFADVVILFVKENHKLPMSMLTEKLRKELRAIGMLSNNELLNALPKVLDDHRFAWSNDGKNVCVREKF